MANEGGGKFRKQRQHYRKPYESQKTLFYRMTDAVRGIWSQSWVSRLLPSSNPADQLPPPPQPPTTTTTSTQLDESLPGPSSPPSSSHLEQRQLRSSLNSNFQPTFHQTAEREDVTFAQPFGSAPPRQTLSETSTTQVVRQVTRQAALDGLDQCLSTNGRGEVGSSSRRRKKWTETVTAVTAAGKSSDNQSEASEESVSTSGCSSLVPHVDKREYQKEVLQLSQSALNKLSEELQRNASPLQTNANVRRAATATVKNRVNPEDDSESGSARTSLWSEPTDAAGTSKPQPVAHGNRPKFQASLLGSALWAEKSVLNDTAANSHNSTFYKGTTTFGGASAYGKLKLHQNTPYGSSLATRRQIRVKSAKSATSDVDIMSATAKRILHSLEKMSTPVLDAKKIPNDHSTRLNTNQILLPGYGKRPNKGPPSRMLTSTPVVGPPVGKLMTPAPVSTTKVQFAPTKPAATVAKVVEIEKVDAKRTEATTSTTTYTEKTNKSTPATGGGKMRSARSELHYSSHAAKDEDVDVPDLPNIPLPIKNLPTFNLLLPVQKQNTEKLSDAEKDKTAKGFTFASPIALPAKTVAAVNSEKTSQVEKTSAKSNVTAVTDREEMPEVAASSSVVSKTSQQTKAGNAVSAGQQVGVASEYKFSLPLSVVSPPKPSPAPVSVTFKMPEPKVPTKKRTSYGESDTSLEMSPKSSPGSEKVFGGLQPAAELKMGSVMDILGGKKTKKTSGDGEKKTVEKEKVQLGFGTQFRPKPGSWECQVCLVRNGPSSSKCQSCDEPKVKLQSENKPGTSVTTVNFGDKFKPLAGSWECSSCMLRNKPDVDRCAACEASKPKSKTVSATPATQESTVVPSSTVVTVTQAPPLTSYKLSESMWECETCLVRNNVDSSQCIACESPKPGAPSTANSSNNSTGGFKMNVKPPMTTTAPAMFKFGFQATTEMANTPAQTATNTSALTFGTPSVAATATAATDGLFKFGATPTTAAQTNAFKPAAVMEGFKFGVPKETNKEDTKSVAGLKVEAVPENAVRDVVTIPKSNSEVKFTVTFGAPGIQELGTTFGTPSLTKPAVTSSAPPLTTTSLFGSPSIPMVFKDVQSASAQSSTVMKTPGQFTFGTGQLTPEVQKQVTTTASSVFTVADTKTTTASAPSGGFRFAVGQKDESGRGPSEASPAKRPALAPQPSLPSFSAFTNTTTAAASTSSTTMGGFSFGVPPPISSSTAPAAVFGSMAPSAAKNHSAAFTFGSSLATTPTHNPTPSFSTPTFGALAASNPVQPTQSTAPTPVFGQMTSSGPTSTFGSSATAPSFTFGSTSTPPGQNLFGTGPVTGNVSANLPAFGSGSNVSALSFNSPAMATPSVPSFAAPSANLLPSYKSAVANLPASSGAGFNFGAAPAAPAPTFQFGAQPQQMQQPQQPSGGFSFGAMQAPQAQQSNMFAFGASSSSVSATPTTGFNFNPATPKAFNFSGTTEPPTFAANPNAAADANPRVRQIKRARRRTFK